MLENVHCRKKGEIPRGRDKLERVQKGHDPEPRGEAREEGKQENQYSSQKTKGTKGAKEGRVTKMSCKARSES